ncbi:MAG TPA: NmrA family NAD(P)-binding protein [Ktedonobacteraceae bacterium]|nr:NmrA family NAD(P)-binding protein [Ktedonobacteraceae bacterium]
MSTSETVAITGAFSYTGKYITRRLLALGNDVRTLTGHPNNPNPFGALVQVYPFNFEQPDELVKSLQGVTTLYNTYWIRFSHGENTFERAVEHTKTLVDAAVKAGVQRIVHVSITNPAKTSRLPYFRGKAELEEYLRQCGLSYAIIRPTVIFGDEDILINNIAWCLRHFPVFPLFGSGTYRLQPIYVEDMADLVVSAGQQDRQQNNQVIDAVGPDIFTFEELVRLIASVLQRRVILVHVQPALAYYAAQVIEPFIRDVLITRDEIAGLMADLLVSFEQPMGHTHLADWLKEHRNSVGRKYASELARHYR